MHDDTNRFHTQLMMAYSPFSQRHALEYLPSYPSPLRVTRRPPDKGSSCCFETGWECHGTTLIVMAYINHSTCLEKLLPFQTSF